MARRMVDDSQEVYRIVVTRWKMVDNPNWVRGAIGPDNPRRIRSTEQYVSTYGPYNSVGTARAQLTFQTLNSDGEPHKDAAGGHIEKASTTWAVVQ